MIDTKELREIGATMDELNELLDRLEEAESECLEEARLNGMGSEREAALMAKLEAAEKERDKYKVAYSEWREKTEWVQEGINSGAISSRYLGWHRADVTSDLLKKAEKERDALRTELKETWHRATAAENTIKALRAKIERTEKQEPVGKFIQHPSHGMWEQDGYGDNPDAKPLYTLPGAQPAPSVPPELEPNGMYDGSHHYASGWNDCRAAMLEAQPEDKP